MLKRHTAIRKYDGLIDTLRVDSIGIRNSQVYDAIASAISNAELTVTEDPSVDYEDIALASLVCILSNPHYSNKTRSWFERRGIRI